MRTFRILAAGWVIGGAAIVAMSAASQTTRAANVQPALANVGPASAGPGRLKPALHSKASDGLLRMPVLGIAREELLDTFTQARGSGRVHNAIDICAPRGTPVVAVVDGRIRKLFNSRAGGLTIYQYDVKEERVYYYAHLDRYADGLREGALVPEGTVIGYVGTTGNAPPGTPHLHFAVEVLPPTKEWWKGEAVNPYPLLTTRVSALR